MGKRPVKRALGVTECRSLTGVNGEATGQEGAPSWSTDRLDVVVVQDHSVVRERIEVRSRDLLRSVKPDIVPALKQARRVAHWCTHIIL